MTNQEVLDLLVKGNTRFVAKRSKRVYFIHSDQQEILKMAGPAEDLLLIGFPETLSPRMAMRRYRGRKWVWLSPKNINPAPSEDKADGPN